jgi:predicted amidohydrolase YtcJ
MTGRLSIFLLVGVGLLSCEASVLPPDTIFTGRFVTLDDLQPEVEALSVTRGRIVASGSLADIEALAGESTQTVEIGGVAVPGFADFTVLSEALRSVASGELLDLTVRMTAMGGDMTFDVNEAGGR